MAVFGQVSVWGSICGRVIIISCCQVWNPLCWSNNLLGVRSPLLVFLHEQGVNEFIGNVQCVVYTRSHVFVGTLTPTLSWSRLLYVVSFASLWKVWIGNIQRWRDDNVVSSVYCRSVRFNPPAAVDTLSWQMNTQPPALPERDWKKLQVFGQRHTCHSLLFVIYHSQLSRWQFKKQWKRMGLDDFMSIDLPHWV